jgi:outer membrane protein OmpA-like peptidoglycan-associated protein
MSGCDFDGTPLTSGVLTPLKALVAAAFVALLAAPGGVLAQGLPSADALEAEEPTDETVEPDAAQEPEAAAEDDDASAEPADEESASPEQQASEDQGSQDSATEDGSAEKKAADQKPVDSEDSDDGAVGDSRLPGSGVNVEGARGFQHIASAIPGKPNTYRVAFLGSFTKGSDVVRWQDENEFVSGNFLLQATFLEHFSANLGVRASNNVNTFGRPQAMLAQGDVHLGVRGHFAPRKGVYLAGDLTTYVPTGFASAGLDASATSVRPRLIATADFGELVKLSDGKRLPLTGHFNFGYLFDNTSNMVPESIRPTRVERFAHDISGYDYLQFGLGVEYALPYVSPFLAWNLDIPVNADVGVCAEAASLPCVSEKGFAAFPDILSLGLRAEPVENLGLTAGVDIGLSGEDAAGIPVTAPWQMIVGASWAIDPEPKIEYVEKVVEKEKIVEKMPEQGFIIGTVTDQKSGDPIGGAMISYKAPTAKTPQATGPEGTFLSYGFEPGKEVVVELSHPDYEAAEARQMIDGEGEVEMAVALKPVAKQGRVGGTVIDQDGKAIPNATIKLTGPDTATVSTGADGTFNRKVAAGEYTVAASAVGYLTGGRDAKVASNKELQLEITLKPEPKEKLVEVKEDRIRIKQKVFFETGKAKILPRSFDVLNQIGSVLLETPRIDKLRIDGHTDDVGAEDYNRELSQERADSVRNYLIEKSGISRGRLSSRGLGESQPLVPNVSDRNRSLNRRVEFRIVDQGLEASDDDQTQ